MPSCFYQLLGLLDKADEPIVCIFYFFFNFQVSWERSALAAKLGSALSLLGDQENSFLISGDRQELSSLLASS